MPGRQRTKAKKQKKSNGEGTISLRASRGVYEGRLTVGHKTKLDADGNLVRVPIRKTFTGATEQEVRNRLTVAKAAMLAGEAPQDGNSTVGQYLTWWIETALPGTVADSTVANYRHVARSYILPHLGTVRLAHLTPTQVTHWLRDLEQSVGARSGKPLSSNSRRLARSVLRRALRRAQQEGLVTRNAAAIADGVKVTKLKEGRTLSIEQARTLLDHIATHDNPRIRRLEPAWITALSLGLRRGELLGLRWEDLVLDAASPLLIVRYALRRSEGAGLILDSPKTADSRRTLNLPAAVARKLSEHRRTQIEERLHAGPEWVTLPLGHDLVFRTEFGTALDPDNFRQYTYRVTESALGQRWSPHELRHSAASILLAQGVPLEVVSETLGHSSIRVTKDVYGHLMAPARQLAADAMTDALFGDAL